MTTAITFALLLALMFGSEMACKRIDRKRGTCSWHVGWYAVVAFLLLLQAVATTSGATGWLDYLHAALEFAGAFYFAYCAISTEWRHRLRQVANEMSGGAR